MIASLFALALSGAEPAQPAAPNAGHTAPVLCGAVERPGIAERGDDGSWRGLAVDLCRHVAGIDRGTAANVLFHAYRTREDLRAALQDSLAVLSDAERAVALGKAPTKPGKPVAISRQVLVVRANDPKRSSKALAGQRVCFIMATEAERALNTWVRRSGMVIKRVGFQEPVELRDALDSGYCAAMAVDAGDIPGGAGRTRLLGTALSELPLFAITAGSKSAP